MAAGIEEWKTEGKKKKQDARPVHLQGFPVVEGESDNWVSELPFVPSSLLKYRAR